MNTIILVRTKDKSNCLWEWICPECGKINLIKFDSMIVQCKKCGEIYNTDINKKDNYENH